MIINVGFQFDRASKSWNGAFMFAANAKAAAQASEHNMSDTSKFHYELLSLDEITKRELTALNSGDQESYAVFNLAKEAIEDVENGNRATPYDLPPDFKESLFSKSQDGEMFKVIDPSKDVDWTEFFLAQKIAKVKAEKVPAGTVVETIMSDGHVETKKTAGPNGGYKVTNPTGEQYLVDTEKFESIYDKTGHDGIYQPKPDPRKMVTVDKNISFKAPWGEEMKIKKDGVLVHQGIKDVYGIQPDEYRKTYAPS